MPWLKFRPSVISERLSHVKITDIGAPFRPIQCALYAAMEVEVEKPRISLGIAVIGLAVVELLILPPTSNNMICAVCSTRIDLKRWVLHSSANLRALWGCCTSQVN
jgi:hypothetical protein